MFIFLSKFLPLLIYPLGLACFLLVLVLFVVRKPEKQRILLAAAVIILWLGGNRWVAMGLARSLEWRHLPPEQAPQAEVIVLLGGGTVSAEYPRMMVEVNGAGDRVLYAAKLYQDGKAPNILLSGGKLDWVSRADTPAQQMASLLELVGVPKDVLWLESESRNTYENALYSARILQDKGINQVLLVTSASHMPRSVQLFEAQGLDVIPLPTDFVVTESGWRSIRSSSLETILLNLIPSVDNLALTTRILKEYIGIFIYGLRGWL